MIDEKSLDITKKEIQKKIVKLLYENNEITINQYNMILSKLDKKIETIKKKEVKTNGNLNPIIVNTSI